MNLTASLVYVSESEVSCVGCWMMARSLYRGQETVSGRQVSWQGAWPGKQEEQGHMS